MTDAELLAEMHALGIDADTYRVLVLLPLVQVAWADGQIQDAERALILDLAERRYGLGDDAKRLLHDWLLYPPTPAYIDRGRMVVRALVQRSRGIHMEPATIDEIVNLAHEVAGAAGGLFGIRRVDSYERDAIREIAIALAVDSNATWDPALAEEPIDDPPTDAVDAEEMDRIRERATTDRQAPPRVARHLSPAVLVPLDTIDERTYAVMGRLAIGRRGTNDVVLPGDAKVSRCHCAIVVDDGKYWIEDVQSENGTWVNGERITRRRLFGGEEVMVGGTLFQFQLRA